MAAQLESIGNHHHLGERVEVFVWSDFEDQVSHCNREIDIMLAFWRISNRHETMPQLVRVGVERC